VNETPVSVRVPAGPVLIILPAFTIDPPEIGKLSSSSKMPPDWFTIAAVPSDRLG
jgi:hypothetical protein